MTEPATETPTIYTRLNAVEKEIYELRELIRATAPKDALTKPAEYPHIERVPNILGGEPIIKGTRTPVRAIVEHWRFGQAPEEIVRHLPYLRLAQVFDSLAYYDDHREEIDHYIEINQAPVE